MNKTLRLTFSLGVALTAVASMNNMSLAQEAAPTAAELELMKGFPPPEDKRVDATNWTLPPYNRWGFQNVRRFHATAPLALGTGEAVPWTIEPQNLDALSVEDSVTLKRLLEEYLTDAIVVIHRGQLVYERYWNGMTPQSPHWLASVSKSVIGTAASVLVDRGVLDRNSTVKDIIPELAESGFGDATIGQLLDMTAGTTWDESMEELLNPDSPARQYGVASGSWKIKGLESDGVFAFLPTIEKERELGASFLYNSPQVDVLGWIVARVTGKPVERIVSDELWSSLAAESPAYYFLDTAGYAWATGGLSISARDLARFGQLMLNEGQWNGRRIFPTTVVTDIRFNGDVKAFANGSHADLYPGGAYRNFWWVKNNADGVYMAKGVFGQYIYINPAKETVIVRFASEKVSADRKRMKRVEAAFDAIATHLDRSK